MTQRHRAANAIPALVAAVAGAMIAQAALSSSTAAAAQAPIRRLPVRPDAAPPTPSTVRVPVLPAPAYDYTPARLPGALGGRNVTRLDTSPRDNPITDAGATLGRVLFYDRRLSANDTIACASGHSQATGFASDTRFGTGFHGGSTARKPMGLSNARFYGPGRYFWDERAITVGRTRSSFGFQ